MEQPILSQNVKLPKSKGSDNWRVRLPLPFPVQKQLRAVCWDEYISMAKSIAWGQSQFFPCLPLQVCAWWAMVPWLGTFSVSQAGGNEPSFGTAALANLMLNVTQYWSFHEPCMENLMSRHILPWGWGGRRTDTAYFSSPWEPSPPSRVFLCGVWCSAM